MMMPIMIAMLVQMQATQVQMHASLVDVQATLVDVQATLVDVQATSGQLLASQARLEQLHRINSHNSLARVSNSHAQQALHFFKSCSKVSLAESLR